MDKKETEKLMKENGILHEKANVTLVELKKLEDSSERLGREIKMLSRSFKKMANQGLKRETLVLLLHDTSRVGKQNIREILKAFDKLEENYLKPEAN